MLDFTLVDQIYLIGANSQKWTKLIIEKLGNYMSGDLNYEQDWKNQVFYYTKDRAPKKQVQEKVVRLVILCTL